MDTRLLKHYEAELAYMRDMGAEFAQAYPKIASRLGMDGVEVVDPYVERLLEGSAFLSARVQLELELQYPALTSHLLEIVYPHYLCPTPSMMVAAFEPDMENASLEDGYVIPRHSELRSTLTDDDTTPCVFRTSADVIMWPITISEAEYIDGRGELVAAGVSRDTAARAGIRLRLKRHGDLPIAELSMDRLVLFLDAQSGKNWALHELLCTQVSGVVGRSTDRRADWVADLPNGDVVPRGYDPDEALLPTPQRSFDGYRLLQEYFAMPQRFHFVELTGLSMALARAKGSDVDIYILLNEGDSDVAPGVTPEAFTLNAVPAINLFHKRCDRVQVSPASVDHHVVADRTAPLDFEIFALESVEGISADGEKDVDFRPFYSEDDLTPSGDEHHSYFTQVRKMRQRSERERLKGVRTSYLGSELFVSLVDSAKAPYSAKLDQLAVQAMVTNRDLPLLLSTGSKNVFHLPSGGPVASVSTPVSPTRPRQSLAQGDTAWRLVSHLSLNYISIAEEGSESGDSAALRELIGIYAPAGDKVLKKQLEGLVSVSSRPIVRRMADEILSTAVRGMEISVTFDESFFEGTSAYALGAVLERFFRKYVSINSFTETALVTQQRGEITRWRPKTGLGRIL
ncbi:type VI secretion system baseplate subunit TssF [Tateyamaria sp. ANG-S1]|uniref:type VI secretion system baseplate subunit TssF n=1 Tax=Tateyamaria sp. ANG-S1 TaxID=1577905 RepID=UPI00057FB822|nr:type VI secretion system baseplate subunit TssF [Tateyamaria sp. ANG-S1]KIC47728.1 type VI secretion protein [Tateyamaria sp. ANG-S1]